MHNKRLMFIVFVILSLVPFSGCIKYYKLAKSEFPQGKDHADKRTVVANNVRTARIYHEFSTKAIFNTLWLSDETRSSYVDMFCEKRGKDEQTKEAMLRRQLEENKHWITFYVLADIRDRTHVSLTDSYPMWSMYLDVHGGEKVQPISIKEAEVNPEYQFIFGHRFNMFKRAYMVKFPATSLGVLICGSGVGVSVAANRFSKIYAALCWNSEVAKMAKEDDGANVLVLPANFVTTKESFEII